MIQNCEFFVGTGINPDYEAIKRFLTVRPYPVDAPGVETSLHKTVGDIALVLYAVLWEDLKCAGTKVPKEMEEVWGVTTLFEDAFQGIDPRVVEMDEFLFNPTGYTGVPLDNWEGDGSFCLTTAKRLNGAVAIFKPGVAERIERAIGSFWAVFTSVHEAMIHPMTEVDADILQVIMDSCL